MSFDRLKTLSTAEGLSLPAGRQGVILSGPLNPNLKIGGVAPSNVSNLLSHYLDSMARLDFVLLGSR